MYNYFAIPLISQLVKAGTSVGVPIYRDEADDAESKKDFSNWFFLGQLGLGGGIKLFVVLIFGDINNCTY